MTTTPTIAHGAVAKVCRSPTIHFGTALIVFRVARVTEQGCGGINQSSEEGSK